MSNKLLAPFEYKGYTNQYLFSYWFENILYSTLKANDYVILDNAAVHNKQELNEIAVFNGINIIFLPAYSPDLNPIEKCWTNFKKKLRKIIKELESFKDAITIAFNETFSG